MILNIPKRRGRRGFREEAKLKDRRKIISRPEQGGDKKGGLKTGDPRGWYLRGNLSFNATSSLRTYQKREGITVAYKNEVEVTLRTEQTNDKTEVLVASPGEKE